MMKKVSVTALIILSAIMIQACQKTQDNAVINNSSCLTELLETITIEAGTAIIGTHKGYREEAPQREVSLKAFDIDAHEVTNKQFKAFIDATDYITDAEKPQAGFNVPGGAVFTTPSPINPSWWQFVEGASWKHPEGPESSIEGHDFDPVVQISLKDARAYADWKGRRLPTANEWEYAAKGNSQTHYVWGDEKTPNGTEMANTWQGAFPLENSAKDGFPRRAPIGCFPKNNFGLYDMIGNVWEWTDTQYVGQSPVPQYTIKGGSFLCSENYCQRYRAAAMQPQDADFTTNHIGFRTVSK